MAVFYNYIKGCGKNATLGTQNVVSGQTLKGTSGNWTSISDHWVFLKWQNDLYYNKNGDTGSADFRDARNNPLIFFNNTSDCPAIASRQLSTGRIITSEARGQEMWYDLTFKDGPALNSTSHSMSRETKFYQNTTSFYTNTANWTINDTSNSDATIMHLYGKNITGGPLIQLNYPVAINNNITATGTLSIGSVLNTHGGNANNQFQITQSDITLNGSVFLAADEAVIVPSSTSSNVKVNRNLEVDTSKYCSAGYFNATSDKRAKENIRKADFSALAIVNSLPIYNFNYKNSDKPSIGVIAQEALKHNIDDFSLVENEEATGENNDYMSIKESKLIYVLWKAIQEQQKEIENLKSQLRGDK